MPFVDPNKIVVPEDRYRQDLGDIDALAADIEKTGQFIPIMVQKDMTLIYGERRLRACQKLNRKVWYIHPDEGQVEAESRLQIRRIELMENVARKDMTPVEQSKAIYELDQLMKDTYGQSGGHKTEGWSYQDTAELLGLKSKTSVYDAAVVARAAEVMPELRAASTMQDAKRIVQSALRVEAVKELARRSREVMPDGIESSERLSKMIVSGDCRDILGSLPDKSVNIFLTDPPFGLNIGKIASTPTKSGLGGLYDDAPEETLDLLFDVVHLMKKKGRSSCFVYMFCAAKNFYTLDIWFRQAGFEVYNKPLIWVDAYTEPKFLLSRGLCNMPSRWPSSNYSTIIFACRGEQPLVRQGLPDVIITPGVKSSDKVHPVEQPVELLVELISRVHHPGMRGLVVDPFCGSGASARASLHFEGLDYLGIELDPEHRERAVAKLISYYEVMTRPKPKGAELANLISADEEF